MRSFLFAANRSAVVLLSQGVHDDMPCGSRSTLVRVAYVGSSLDLQGFTHIHDATRALWDSGTHS